MSGDIDPEKLRTELITLMRTFLQDRSNKQVRARARSIFMDYVNAEGLSFITPALHDAIMSLDEIGWDKTKEMGELPFSNRVFEKKINDLEKEPWQWTLELFNTRHDKTARSRKIHKENNC